MAQVPGRTIFAPVSKQDPKHGRWILPLVVAALVLFTYTFVNNLPPAETPTTTTAVASERTTTTEPPPETTTTTLAPEVIALITTLDALAEDAESLRETAQTINDEFSAETTGYGDTRDAMSDLRVETSDFNDRVGAVEIPTAGEEQWGDVTIAAATMQLEADNMWDGLVNTSGSEKRLAALDDYNIAAATFVQKLDDVKAAITTPAETP